MSDHKRDEFDDLISFFQLNSPEDQPAGASVSAGRQKGDGVGDKTAEGQTDGADDFPVYPPLEGQRTSATVSPAAAPSAGLDGDDDLFNMEDLTQKLSKRGKERQTSAAAVGDGRADGAGLPSKPALPTDQERQTSAAAGRAAKQAEAAAQPAKTTQPAAVSVTKPASPPSPATAVDRTPQTAQPRKISSGPKQSEDFQMNLPADFFLDGETLSDTASSAGKTPLSTPPEKSVSSSSKSVVFDGGEDEPPSGHSGGDSGDGGRKGGGAAKSGKKGGGRGGRFFRAMLCVLVVLALSGFFAIFLLESANDLLGFNKADAQIEVVIPQEAQLGDISSILSEEGVISQPLTFQIYAKLRKMADSFQPGTYLLNSNMSYDEIMLALKNATNVTETIRLTFPEGMSLYEIAQMLEENKVCDAQAFIDVLQTGDFDYEFIQMLPDDELRFYRLEGYIFPDTYDFFIGEKPISVAKKFLDAFNARVTSDLYDRMRDLNMTLDEAITLASIIQKEASNSEQMYMVSSVFHNRLERAEFPSRMLQSDVTINYVENFIKPRLDITNQPMYDAYNTYVCTGLPVGPICSPGLDAIDAALYPDTSDYFYFLTDKEGRYYYAQTGDEHYRNEREAESAGGVDHGTDTQ